MSMTRARMMVVACLLAAILGSAASAGASEPASRANLARACASLETSLTQPPTPDSRIALADCYAQHGHNASAWSQYRKAADAARAGGALEFERIAHGRAKALESDLSYVTVTTWKGQELRITQDGKPIDEAVRGTAIPLDPGRHTIQASAPGKRGWSKQIELGTHGDHVTVLVPVLPDDVELLTSELRASAAPILPADTRAAANTSPQRTFGLVAGALGIAGIATGTLFGVKAAADWSDAKARCQPYPYCGQGGALLAQEAKTSALVSTLGFATGIIGLSGGALLWFTAESSTAPALSVGVGRVQLRGAL